MQDLKLELWCVNGAKTVYFKLILILMLQYRVSNSPMNSCMTLHATAKGAGDMALQEHLETWILLLRPFIDQICNELMQAVFMCCRRKSQQCCSNEIFTGKNVLVKITKVCLPELH